MSNLKKLTAVLLAVILSLSLSITVFAESEKSNTENLMSLISQTGKFNANVTSFTYGKNITNNIKFNFYDDLTGNKMLCDFVEKNISVYYDSTSLKVVFKQFFSYLNFDLTNSQFIMLTGAVTLFQKTLKSFVDDPALSAFTFTSSTVEKNGQIYTCENYKGKLIGTSGTFYYDQNGNVCEIVLTDNAGESIGFTISSFSNTFDSSVLSVPFYYFNISYFWKIITIFLSVFKITMPILGI